MKQSPTGFDVYLVNIKSCGRLFQIFVASSECPNFKKKILFTKMWRLKMFWYFKLFVWLNQSLKSWEYVMILYIIWSNILHRLFIHWTIVPVFYANILRKGQLFLKFTPQHFFFLKLFPIFSGLTSINGIHHLINFVKLVLIKCEV